MDNMQLRQVLADNLARAMETDPNLDTQEKLAARSGLSQSHISRLLLCEASATLDALNALSLALRCQPWELLTSDESMRRGILERLLGAAPVADSKVEQAFSIPPRSKVVAMRRRKK